MCEIKQWCNSIFDPIGCSSGLSSMRFSRQMHHRWVAFLSQDLPQQDRPRASRVGRHFTIIPEGVINLCTGLIPSLHSNFLFLQLSQPHSHHPNLYS